MADISRSTKFLNAAITAAAEFARLNEETVSDHTSDSDSKAQGQKYGKHKCHIKLKRKRQNLTKQEEVLQFFKKPKFFANPEKDLSFIQKVIREGIRRTKLPQNSAVVPDEFSVPESEAGKYYAEVNIQHIYVRKSCADGRCNDIGNFERTNHPDMFQQAIRLISLQIQKWTTFRRTFLGKFPSDNVLKIRDNKICRII